MHAATRLPMHSRRKTTPIFMATGEVIDLALVAVYRLKNGSVCPGSAVEGIPRFYAAAPGTRQSHIAAVTAD
jgi:hypothetical protein